MLTPAATAIDQLVQCLDPKAVEGPSEFDGGCRIRVRDEASSSAFSL
jgi:hypothetical protein